MPSLLATIQGLDPFLRAHLDTIHIRSGSDGYYVTLSINHYGSSSRIQKEGIEEDFLVLRRAGWYDTPILSAPWIGANRYGSRSLN